MAQPASFDEQVARITADRMIQSSKQIAAMRGLPAEMRYATPEQELALYEEVDESVDPVVVIHERMAEHTKEGLPPEMALAEAIVETAAVVFPNRLALAGSAGRLTLTEQCAYLERMAKKSREHRGQMQGQMVEEV